MKETILAAEKIKKSFGDIHPLKKISLEAKKRGSLFYYRLLVVLEKVHFYAA